MADTKQEESAWWKLALSLFVRLAVALGILFLALGALFWTWNFWDLYRPDHLGHPVNRHINAHYAACRDGTNECGPWPLIPQLFRIGDRKDEVHQVLEAAGYVPSPDGAETYIHYSAGVTADWQCQVDFYIDVAFSDVNRLTTATGRYDVRSCGD